MKRKSILFFPFISIIIIAALIIVHFPNKAVESSVIFSGMPYDGYVANTGHRVYDDSWEENSGDFIDSNSEAITVGQSHVSGYNIARAFTYFDTSSVPYDKTIISAKLSYRCYQRAKTTNFTLIVQSGMPNCPNLPLQLGDYCQWKYGGNGGSLATDGISSGNWFNITLNSDGRSWINKSGITKFVLRGDADVNHNYTQDTYIHLYDSGCEYAPMLYVIYS